MHDLQGKTMNKFDIDDIVTPTTYYESANKGSPYIVRDTSYGSNGQLIRISSYNNSSYYGGEGTWFKANNFRYHTKYLNNKESNGSIMNNQIVIVRKLIVIDDGNPPSYEISREASDILDDQRQFNSIKEAHDYCKEMLEENPEAVYGIFPMQTIALIEKPPVKFKTVKY